MNVNPRAGSPATAADLIDSSKLVLAYFAESRCQRPEGEDRAAGRRWGAAASGETRASAPSARGDAVAGRRSSRKALGCYAGGVLRRFMFS